MGKYKWALKTLIDMDKVVDEKIELILLSKRK
jgi:hypothetical protein